MYLFYKGICIGFMFTILGVFFYLGNGVVPYKQACEKLKIEVNGKGE